MEKLVSKLVALGVPGLVLLVAAHISGYVGAAAVVAALSSLGPGGIIGGIATLGVIGLIVHGLSEYGLDAIFNSTIHGLIRKGETKESILKKIERYPISKNLKSRLREEVNKAFYS